MEHFMAQPYAGFQGKVGKTFADSEPWWPPRVEARTDNPNVIIMIVDDLGFSDLGCFGSEIDTPNLDQLAADGLRFTNFHVTPLCSPTRASLLTGCESHAVGFGYVANVDPGFPGYTSELPRNQPTMAEVFRDHGYSTFAVGKWHLCRDSDLHEAADKHSWPLQRGFEQYYGFLEALTNFHHPHRMFRGNEAIEVDVYPDGYYLTDDLTDEAIKMVRAQKAADPSKPFFLYFAHGAVHAPLHAKAVDMEKYRGRYAMGWDALRQQRYERQLALGVLEPGTGLAPRNTEVPEDVRPWDELSPEEQELFARYMEVYAAMVDNVDQNFGRLRQVLAELGQLDNTIIHFFSDNGASREGMDRGTMSYFGAWKAIRQNIPTEVFKQDHARIDEAGGPTTWPHYPRGFAMASNTPFRLYKLTGHAGGHQVAMITSWPERLRAVAGQFRRQYVHVTDLLDTYAELLGFTIPDQRNGMPAVPRVGKSFASILTDSSAKSLRTENFIEVFGHRSFYRDGWEIATFHRAGTRYTDAEWELFDLINDPTQLHDLAAERPEKLSELAAAWEQAAWANQAYPLEDGVGVSRALRPPDHQRLAVPITVHRDTPSIERVRASLITHEKSFRVVVNFGPGGLGSEDNGILVAHGGQESGWALYIEDGELIFVQNLDSRMRDLRTPAPIGAASVELAIEAPGKRAWNVALSSEGRRLAEADGFLQFIGFLPFEGIDIGIDRRSPVSWDLYRRHGAFRFSGSIHTVRFEPGAPSPDAAHLRLPELRAQAAKYD